MGTLLRLTSGPSFSLWVADITYVIQHSNQGRQYTTVGFGKRCREAAVRPSWARWTTRTPMRGVFEQPGDVGKSLDVSAAREVEIPAIGLRLAREGLLQVVAAPRSLQALSCPLESSLRRLGGERRGAAGTWRYGGGRRAARPRPFLRQAAQRP